MCFLRRPRNRVASFRKSWKDGSQADTILCTPCVHSTVGHTLRQTSHRSGRVRAFGHHMHRLRSFTINAKGILQLKPERKIHLRTKAHLWTSLEHDCGVACRGGMLPVVILCCNCHRALNTSSIHVVLCDLLWSGGENMSVACDTRYNTSRVLLTQTFRSPRENRLVEHFVSASDATA